MHAKNVSRQRAQGAALMECMQTMCARSGPVWHSGSVGPSSGSVCAKRVYGIHAGKLPKERTQGAAPWRAYEKTCGERHCMVHAANARRDCVQAVFPSMLRRECVQGMCPENVREERPHGVPAENFTHREWAAQRTCAQSVAKRHAQGLCAKRMITHSNKQRAHT